MKALVQPKQSGLPMAMTSRQRAQGVRLTPGTTNLWRNERRGHGHASVIPGREPVYFFGKYFAMMGLNASGENPDVGSNLRPLT